MVHLSNSGFVVLSGDVAHLENNFEIDIVPSLNTSKADSIDSMQKIKKLLVRYNAKLVINHDKEQTDTLKLLPDFYD